MENTHANEVTLLELIPQQKTVVEDSPLELEEFSSTVKITHEVILPEHYFTTNTTRNYFN